jgi:probable F420-dependent oxidoreductase
VKIGSTFSLDWLEDLGAAREAAQALEEAGFDSVATAGHVLTAARGRYPDRPEATYALAYRDPFVLFTHLAAATRAIHFRTAILILPLYPTALVARQAADLSVVSDGRFELGVSISWQEAEYVALGQDIHTRGRRLEEQLELLRLFWSETLVTFHGRFHTIDGLGLGALPAHPVPIWIGCTPQPRLLRRVARLGDGWLPIVDPSPHVEELQAYAREAGRDPAALGIAARLNATGSDPETWVAEAKRFREAGATEITLSPPPGANATDGVAAMIATKDAIASVAT